MSDDARIAEAYVAGLTDLEVCALRVRYALGQSLRRASQEEGARVVGHVSASLRAAGLRLDVSALRRIRRVASVIRPDEFEDLVTLRSAAGLPLKWSHLELLASLRVRARRTKTAHAILAAMLTYKSATEIVRTTTT